MGAYDKSSFYKSKFLELYRENGYRENILNPIITAPYERNYSDDEQYSKIFKGNH